VGMKYYIFLRGMRIQVLDQLLREIMCGFVSE